MSSIAIKHWFAAGAAVLLAATGAAAQAGQSDTVPKNLQEPLLGLRLPAATAKLDPFPDNLRAICAPLADTDVWTGRQWIYGEAKTADATYYLVNGYFKRRNPQAGERLYFQPEEGGIFKVVGTKCDGDQASETFDLRDPKQIPPEVLQQLARDLATRLVRATGGADRLRTEIRNQRIDFNELAPDVQGAFKPYFDQAK